MQSSPTVQLHLWMLWKLLGCLPWSWGRDSLQKAQIAGTRQQWQYGSNGEEVCSIPGSRTVWAGPSMSTVVEPKMHKLFWSAGNTQGRVLWAHNAARCPRELPLQRLQTGSSECHSATPERLCPEPRNAKQMSAWMRLFVFNTAALKGHGFWWNASYYKAFQRPNLGVAFLKNRNLRRSICNKSMCCSFTLCPYSRTQLMITKSREHEIFAGTGGTLSFSSCASWGSPSRTHDLQQRNCGFVLTVFPIVSEI